MIKDSKVVYVGPLRDFSGYAHAARDYVRALDAEGVDVATRDVIYDGGSYKRTDREEELANKSVQDIDILIQHTTPNETEPKEGVFNVSIFCWETDLVPQPWVDQLNKMDLVIVSCEANIKACRKGGVETPIIKVPFAADMERFKAIHEPFEMGDAFKFLAICQYSKKKGIDSLLKAYLSEFTADDNVMLILKTYMGPNDGEEEKQKILSIINSMKRILRLDNYPPIRLIHEVMSDSDIDRLYATADCYVLPSRGEGWSIPHFDALGHGLPAIAVNWGGPTEFITDECGWLINYNMSPVCNMMHPFPYLYTAKENWAEPHVDDLMKSMREAVVLEDERLQDWHGMQAAARERVCDFSHDKVGPLLVGAIEKYYKMWKEHNVLSGSGS